MIDVAGGNEVYYYHYDGLGSVTALSDSSGNIVEKYIYHVFGQPTIMEPDETVISSSAYDNPYMFTGRRYDEETGLYYYRARYYSPGTGRFLQTDPIGYQDGLNLYTYVGNNPLNWLDPWGLCKEERSGLRDYLQEVFTWPSNIGDEALRIEGEEYGDFIDPFGGDYRHFLAGGMAARNHGLIPSGIILWLHQRGDDTLDAPEDAAAEWRGWKAAWRHPFTPLRELGKRNIVRPVGPKKGEQNREGK